LTDLPAAEASEVSPAKALMTTSMALTRSWQALMASVGGRLLGVVLNIIKDDIATHTKEVKSDIPEWRSCFKDDIYDEGLANTLCLGRWKDILAAHNGLHGRMEALGLAADALALTPRPEHHAVTRSTVAVAVATLASCKEAIVVCQGIDVLGNRNTILGAKQAEKFIAKFKGDYGALPGALAFWAQLDNEAAYSGSVVKAPPRSQSQAASPVGNVLCRSTAAVTPKSGTDVVPTQAALGVSPVGSVASGTRRGLKRPKA
jgi:hypothetical protein